MTLDEAIKHAEEVAKEKEQDRDVRKIHLDNRNSHNNIVHYEKACKCADEHRQLAEWLKDYKRLLEQNKEEIFKQFKKKAFLESEDVLGNEMVDSYMITDYLAKLLGVEND